MDEYSITGLLRDPRSEEEKKPDHSHERLYGVAPVKWELKSPSKWTRYSIRDQDGSSSCVAQATAKALETMTGVVMSARPIYRRRKNYPEKGMWLKDAGSIMTNAEYGTTTEKLDPSQLMNELKMNKEVFVETPWGVFEYVFITNFKDINVIADAISQNKHCILTVETNYKEWQDIPFVGPDPITFGHGICGTDFTLYKVTETSGAVESIVIDDSWGHFNTFDGRRVLTGSFLNARCTGAMYLKQVVDKRNLYNSIIELMTKIRDFLLAKKQ